MTRDRAYDCLRAANWQAFAMNTPPTGVHLVKFPFFVNATAFYIKTSAPDPVIAAQEPFIFDAEATALSPPGNGTSIGFEWFWHCPNGGNTPAYLAE